MTTKSMAYDHPAYTAVQSQQCGTITGSAGATTKYAAFTAIVLKSITAGAIVKNTNTEPLLVYQVTNDGTHTGTNTTTNTTTLTNVGSAAYYTNLPLPSGGLNLSQGDLWWVAKGTDATATYAITAEYVTQPLAPVTQ